ncbi:iron chaperone [Actinoplanes sp. G11-F43]|uniref:iron chaperone n=1 Tax=Actinoplanes sp. G11-F43 TaxID=3424130 RepID=UPI003D3474F2
MGKTAASIDEYLDGVNPDFRAELARIRTLVTQLVPGVEEVVSYRMPTLKYKGRALVYFTASKKHMSFYPSSWAIEEFRDRLTSYRTTEHSIQFTLENPLPGDLIEDLVRYHAHQIDIDRK